MSQDKNYLWRLELHDKMGLHWNLNDEDEPNTFGYRTVLTCTDEQLPQAELKATRTYARLMRERGFVDYVEFYKAMNK